MRKVLVIGGTGQLGVYLERMAGEHGFLALAPQRSELDLNDFAKVKEYFEKHIPDLVINTAAYHDLNECEKRPTEALQVNCVAVYNLAQLCMERGIKLVTYSTDYVFDGLQSTPYVELDSPRPLQMYGVSKLAGEYAAQNVYKDGVYIIRTAGVYGGKGSRSKRGNFVLNILEATKDSREIEVGMEQNVSTTYARDLATATYSLIAQNAIPNIYHLVNQGTCTWAEFARTAIEYAKIDTVVHGVDRMGQYANLQRPLYSVLANNEAKKLGILLPQWQDSLKDYINEVLADDTIQLSNRRRD